MMRSILASLFLSSAAFAADPEPQGIPFTGGFADGSALPLFVPEAKITIATKYGKLAVPMSEIVRIELGFRYPEGMEAKIKAAAEELASPDFKVREQAQKQLIAWGELSLPAVRKIAKGENPEATQRAEEVLAKLQKSLPKERHDVAEYDVIVTEESSIRGTIETATIKANTKFFGEKNLKLADLRSLANVALSPEVKPGSPKFGQPNQPGSPFRPGLPAQPVPGRLGLPGGIRK